MADKLQVSYLFTDDPNVGDVLCAITLRGIVQRIDQLADEQEKVQVSVEDADELFRDIRIPNAFRNGSGEIVKLKLGDEVKVTISRNCRALIQQAQAL